MGCIRLRSRILELKDDDNCLVLLVRDKKNHAILSIVTQNEDNTINMEAYDFLPAGNRNGSSSTKIETMRQLIDVMVKNSSSDGQIRKREAKHKGKEQMDIRQLWNLFRFEDSGLDAEYLFWEVEPEEHKLLKESIELDIQTPPRFSLGGNDRFFSANGHNCYTWAKEKLNVIGINLETTLWDRLVASEPNDHIQPKNSWCMLS
jgi:hypothetical protein